VELVAKGAIMNLAEEVRGQPAILEKFFRIPMPRASGGSIFVGAGDSYAAALAGFYASGGKCLALDPYTLASAPELAEGREVFFISVSGRTASNVAAARKVGRLARRTVAITAGRRSRLAAAADRSVVLPMEYLPRIPGMLSFTLSLAAVLKISGVDQRCDFRSMFEKASRGKARPTWAKGTTYFLGNYLAYPAALYAAAKTYELLGRKAHAELLEEFSHLELFSLGKGDAVNMFSCFDPGGVSDRLAKILREQGFEARAVPGRGTTGIEKLFHEVFLVQLAVIDEAVRAGLTEPKFLSSGGRLRASDAMIY
jgi:SIS domain-containing protein